MSNSTLDIGDLCPIGRPETLLFEGDSDKVVGKLAGLLSQQNLSMVNLECPLTHAKNPIPKLGPNLKAHPDWALKIRQTGFDVVTLANNHILDMGESGLNDTISACSQASLKIVGAGRNLAEATRALFVEVGEIKVAILALAEHEWNIASADRAGAWPLDLIDNHYQIIQARQQADFVLVILHGGNEYYSLPSPRLVKTCRYFVDQGAHAVVCHHSHVTSGLEIYRGAPIVYSTGNLLFDSARPRPKGWYLGYLVELTIAPNLVKAVRLFPYRQCNPEPNIQPLPPVEAGQFLEDLINLSELTNSPETLERAWLSFCDSKRADYLNRVLGLNRVEQYLKRMGIQPYWRVNTKYWQALRNMVQCEAHRDVLLQLLLEE